MATFLPSIVTLFEWGCVPIITEKDTVSVAEIKFGDNDHLAAMVANLLQAPLLLAALQGLLLWPRAGVICPAPTPGTASARTSLARISAPTARWLQAEVCVPRGPPFRLRVSHDFDHTYRLDDTRSPWVTRASSPPCRPHTPWCDGVEPSAFASIVQARPFPILGRPVHLWDGSL